MTDEQAFVEERLRHLGVEIVTGRALTGVEAGRACFDRRGVQEQRDFDSIVLVTGRLADQTLLDQLTAEDWPAAGIRSITAIGDALSPSSIADAVFSGHRYARLLDTTGPEVVQRERPLPFADEAAP
jgi:dimethylamine/trimethylamine dehydrogenase